MICQYEKLTENDDEDEEKKNDESIFRVCPGSSPAKKELLQTCTGFVIARFSFVIIVIIIVIVIIKIIMMIITTTISIITGITMMVIKVKTLKTDPLPIFDRVRDFCIELILKTEMRMMWRFCPSGRFIAEYKERT